MEELVLELLKKKNLIHEEDSVATNEVFINGNEVVIKGNKLGLILLADYLVQTAIGEKAKNHVHLDVDNFFDKANCELVISKE